MKRGDVVLVRFPHPSGQRGKKRPAVVVQSDAYASTVRTLVVAEKPDHEGRSGLPLHRREHARGKATGLLVDSVVSSLALVTVYVDTVAHEHREAQGQTRAIEVN